MKRKCHVLSVPSVIDLEERMLILHNIDWWSESVCDPKWSSASNVGYIWNKWKQCWYMTGEGLWGYSQRERESPEVSGSSRELFVFQNL